MSSWIEIPAAQLHTFWPLENIGMVNRTGVTSLDQCKTICEGLSDCIFINWSEPHKICLTYQANETLQDTVQGYDGNGAVKWGINFYPEKQLSYEFRDPDWTLKYPEILTSPNFIGYKFSILEDFEKSRTLKTYMRGNPIVESSAYNYISVNYGLKQIRINLTYYGPYNVYFGYMSTSPGCFDLQTLINKCDNDSSFEFSYCQVIDRVEKLENQCGVGFIARIAALAGGAQTYYWYPDKNTAPNNLPYYNLVPNSRQTLLRGTKKNIKPPVSNQQKVIIITLVAITVISALLYSLRTKILLY
jgi:hypothetical protein